MQYRWLILLCCYVFVTAFSCDEGINYDATVKYYVHGVVTDNSGNPVEGVELSLIAFSSRTRGGTINCAVTSSNGEYEFFTSNVNSSSTMISVNDTSRSDEACITARLDHLAYHRSIFMHESYEEYILEQDITLTPAVALNLINSSEANIDFVIDHNGISRIDGSEDSIIETVNSMDTVVHYIAPNQQCRISSLQFSQVDTIINVGTAQLDVDLSEI